MLLKRRFTNLVPWLILGLLALMVPSLTAQDQSSTFPTNTPSGFATNTPSITPIPPMSSLSTNTPLPTLNVEPTATATRLAVTPTFPAGLPTNTPSPTPRPRPVTPDAAGDSYGLRQWLAPDLAALWFDMLWELSADDADLLRAMQITRYEHQRRFGPIPASSAHGERLQLLIDSPAGLLDKRVFVRAHVIDQINQQPAEGGFEQDGLRADLTPLNLDGDGYQDALIHILYPASLSVPGSLLYEDYILARGSADGTYSILAAEPDYPAAPYQGIQGISLITVGDLNDDTRDEVALLIEDGQVNDRLLVLAMRGEGVADLTLPDEAIRVGEIVDWPVGQISPAPLRVLEYRDDSTGQWPCYSQRPVTWRYDNNFYRSSVGINIRFEPQDTLACDLQASEPLFALPGAEALSLIGAALSSYPADSPGYERAQMVQAALYAINGQLDDANAAAASLQAAAAPDSWLARQSETLAVALNTAGNTALDVCEALVMADADGACDMPAVLGRLFADLPLTTDTPLIDQLNSYGLTVVESSTVSEVGKTDRTVVTLGLAGSGRWAFAPETTGEYRAEFVDGPAAPAMTGNLNSGPSFSAFDVLVNDDDPLGATNVAETFRRNNPEQPLPPDLRYAEAVSFDLLGNRQRAIQAYYSLWRDHPDTLWGELAALHLERRG